MPGLRHLAGDVEVARGFRAIVLVFAVAAMSGGASASARAESRDDTAPLCVFVVMRVAASRPVPAAVVWLGRTVARVMPVPPPLATARPGLLTGLVLLAHHPLSFLGLFLLFPGFTQAYERDQGPLIIKEALPVAVFLGRWARRCCGAALPTSPSGRAACGSGPPALRWSQQPLSCGSDGLNEPVRNPCPRPTPSSR